MRVLTINTEKKVVVQYLFHTCDGYMILGLLSLMVWCKRGWESIAIFILWCNGECRDGPGLEVWVKLDQLCQIASFLYSHLY